MGHLLLAICESVLRLILGKRKPSQTPSSPEKILVCNGAHMGDVILTTSVLPVLKALFPEAKIGMLVGSWSLPVVEHHPLVDVCYTLDHWKLNRSGQPFLSKIYHYLKMRAHVLKQLRADGYSIAIDCYPYFPNMAPLLWSAKIPLRIGFSSAKLSAFLTHPFKWDPLENRPLVQAFFSLLAPFQAAKHHHLLKPNLREPAPTTSYPACFLVIHMGAGDNQKKWPIEKWKKLATQLASVGETLFFTGKGEEENGMIEEVTQGLSHTHNLCDQLNWNAFAALIQRASLLVTVDTSAGHVAAAVGTPAVVLFTGIAPTQVWRPFAPNISVLTHPVPCSPCLVGCSKMSCIRSISVDAVFAAIQSKRVKV